jgi:hypothetical protein
LIDASWNTDVKNFVFVLPNAWTERNMITDNIFVFIKAVHDIYIYATGCPKTSAGEVWVYFLNRDSGVERKINVYFTPLFHKNGARGSAVS